MTWTQWWNGETCPVAIWEVRVEDIFGKPIWEDYHEQELKKLGLVLLHVTGGGTVCGV